MIVGAIIGFVVGVLLGAYGHKWLAQEAAAHSIPLPGVGTAAKPAATPAAKPAATGATGPAATKS